MNAFYGKTLLVMLLIGGMASAHAAGNKGPEQIVGDQPVAAQLENVLALVEHEDYSEIKPEDKQRVRDSVARIRNTMGSHEYTSQLNGHDRSVVLTEQSTINTIMTQAHEDSRLICRREKLVGTNRPSQVCFTVAERRRIREGSQRYLRDMPMLLPPPKNGR